MRIRAICIIAIICCAGPAMAQSEGYHLIYGNRDGSPITARLGSTIVIPAWGATREGNLHDSIQFMHMPLASDGNIIVSRDGGYFPDTLVGLWDDISFLAPDTNNPSPGFTSQSMLGFAYLREPRDSQNWFNTNGDTVIICYYIMATTGAPAFADTTVCPFIEGIDNRNGLTIWADGLTEFHPTITYSCLHFVTCDTQPGDSNSDGIFNGIDIIYSVNYLKGIGPPPLCVRDCEIHTDLMVTADANGNCNFNGIDIIYSVNYLKDAAAPPAFCIDCPPLQ